MVIIYGLVHLGLQGVALLVNNVDNVLNQDIHNFVDNSSILPFKNPITLTFPLENDYVDCVFFANVVIDLSRDTSPYIL